jgi:hypothetical protein
MCVLSKGFPSTWQLATDFSLRQAGEQRVLVGVPLVPWIADGSCGED